MHEISLNIVLYQIMTLYLQIISPPFHPLTQSSNFIIPISVATKSLLFSSPTAFFLNKRFVLEGLGHKYWDSAHTVPHPLTKQISLAQSLSNVQGKRPSQGLFCLQYPTPFTSGKQIPSQDPPHAETLSAGEQVYDGGVDVTVEVTVVEIVTVGVESVVVDAVTPTQEHALAYWILLGQ